MMRLHKVMRPAARGFIQGLHLGTRPDIISRPIVGEGRPMRSTFRRNPVRSQGFQCDRNPDSGLVRNLLGIKIPSRGIGGVFCQSELILEFPMKSMPRSLR
jgi:hypothetical protein